MVLEKTHEEQVLKAVRKAMQSTSYGEVKIKINKDVNHVDFTIVTEERIRIKK